MTDWSTPSPTRPKDWRDPATIKAWSKALARAQEHMRLCYYLPLPPLAWHRRVLNRAKGAIGRLRGAYRVLRHGDYEDY